MDNKPKRSKALIITLIILAILAVVLFFIFKNRNATKSVADTNPSVFQSLFGTSKSKNLDVINTGGDGTSGDQSKEGNVLLLQEKGKVTAGEDILPGDFLVKSGDTNSSIVKVAIPNNVNSANLYGIAMNGIDANDTGDILLAGTKVYVTARENVKVGDFVIYIGVNSTENLPIVEIANPNNSRASNIYGIAIKDIGAGSILISDINSNSSLWSKTKDIVKKTAKNVNDWIYRVFHGKSKSTDTGTDTFCLLNPDSPSCKRVDNCPFPKIINVNTNACIPKSECLSPMVINGNQCQNPDNLLCTDTTATNFGAKGVCNYGDGTCDLPKITNVNTNACIDPSDCLSPMIINGNQCQPPDELICKDRNATNFGAKAKCDYTAKVCTNPLATNYNKSLPCAFPPEICLDPIAINFGVEAKCDYGGNGDLPTVTATATPASINSGDSSMISWESTNVTACTLSGGKFTGTAVVNSKTSTGESTGPLTKNTSYVVSCTGLTNDLKTSDNAVVRVAGGGDDKDLPTVTVTATPTKINSGEISIIKWESTNTTTCTLSGGKFTGTAVVTGKSNTGVSTGALTKNTSYVVSCTGANNSRTSGNAVVRIDGGGGGDGDNLPDLTAGSITPTTATVNTTFRISSIIKNAGGGPTGGSFLTSFTVKNSKDVEKSVMSILTPELTAGEEKVVTSPLEYSFNQVGTYLVQACADQRLNLPDGNIAESKENNNCGPWTAIKVEGAIAPPETCLPPKMVKTDTGECVSECTSPYIKIGDKCEAPIISCPPPKMIKTDTMECVSECLSPNVKVGNECRPPVITPNICLDIEKNPLTFTPEEKARLAVLLRKFYLISSTLKTTEDIATIYNEIDQQENFKTQIEDLTTQCYAQVKKVKDTGGGIGWVQHGNPWYTQTSGGTFPYTSEITGYSKNGWVGDLNIPAIERVLNIW